MSIVSQGPKAVNGFAVGDTVEVKSADEILAGLDERGELDSLPFMPEMLQFCGKQFVVDKIAHKTCDTVTWTGIRRMEDTVHLAGLRCDGSGHGGCQAGCLLFWKTDWLTRVGGAGDRGQVSDPAVEPDSEAQPASPPQATATTSGTVDGTSTAATAPRTGCTRERLTEVALGACRPDGDRAAAEGPLYSCQATELTRFVGEVIPVWNARQYVEDVRYGNAPVRTVLRGIAIGVFNKFQDLSRRTLPERFRFKGGVRYPYFVGTAEDMRVETLDLQPGEWVRVKSAEEIGKTLNRDYRNRGLYFDREMLRYCGQTARVLRRVDRIIEETTGRMITMKTPCVILADAVCVADFHRSCPRAIYAYWRESWLERVPAPEPAREAESAMAAQ